MATASHDPSEPFRARREWPARVLVDEMWAALAIASMWIAVLFTAVFGPDMVFTSGSGASTTTIPSAVVVAFFAWLGTRALARPAFGRRERED